MIVEEDRLLGLGIHTVVVQSLTEVGELHEGGCVREVIGGDVAVTKAARSFLGHDQVVSFGYDLNLIV